MKRKNVWFGAVIAGLALFALPALSNAQMGMMGNYWGYNNAYNASTLTNQNSGVSAALKDIYSSQGVGSQAQIDCGKVSDSQFEKLGDAYMSLMLPNESQHEAMDNMMGGEGSASLKQAHINMGRSYLGCWSGYSSGPVYMPMMGGYGGSYLGRGMGWGMMGGYYGSYSWAGTLTMMLVWTLLILGIIALYRFVRRK